MMDATCISRQPPRYEERIVGEGLRERIRIRDTPLQHLDPAADMIGRRYLLHSMADIPKPCVTHSGRHAGRP